MGMRFSERITQKMFTIFKTTIFGNEVPNKQIFQNPKYLGHEILKNISTNSIFGHDFLKNVFNKSMILGHEIRVIMILQNP